MASQLPISDLPEGTVTFLFTDIEGSTKLLNKLRDQYAELLTEHRRILREIFSRWHGQEVDTQGDAFFYSFPRATEAVNAAVEVQRTLAEYACPEGIEVKVRMGLHTGEPLVESEGYVGIDVHRAARIAHVGHGGQVLLSETTTSLIRKELPESVSLKDLGNHRLKDIPYPEHIHQLVIEGLRSEFPPLTSFELHPNNLPIQPTPFIGRKDELEDLDKLISHPDNRLISIVGAGGMGKTRLAIATAEQQLHALTSSNGKEEPRFPDGVFFVRLAPIERIEAILPTIGEATGFQFYEGVEPKQQILDFFREKQLLLLMDNFEHLMGGVSLLPEIIGAAPNVRILVTSRQRLNLRGEVTYALEGMRFPTDDVDLGIDDEPFSAVELFLQCTRRILPDYAPDDEDLSSIGHICRLVEGMPLGLELAAAWMEMLTPDEIASEIQNNLDFLEAETVDTPERHRSIRGVFDYTWKLLGEEEKEILKKASVFRGGFTTEAAREVTGASLKRLLRLTNKSLLHRNQDGRFDIHKLLRYYVTTKLDSLEEIDIGNEHCDYYATFLKEREIQNSAGPQTESLKELDNIRASWNWAVSHDRFDAVRKSWFCLYLLYSFQGWIREGLSTFELAVEALRTKVPLGEKGIAYALSLLGLIWWSDYEKPLEYLYESHSILHEIGSEYEIAIVNLFLVLMDRKLRFEEAIQLSEESIAIAEKLNAPFIKESALVYWGVAASRSGDFIEAERKYLEALQLIKASNNYRLAAECTTSLGYLADKQEDYYAAQRFYRESISYAHKSGFVLRAREVISQLSHSLMALENFDEAHELLIEGLSIDRSTGNQSLIADRFHDLGVLSIEIVELEKAEIYLHNALMNAEGMNERVLIGCIRRDLAVLALTKGDIREAVRNYRAALQIGQDFLRAGYHFMCHYVFSGLALLLTQLDEKERAVELLTKALDHPDLVSYHRVKTKKQLAILQEEMPSSVFHAAQGRGRERDLQATAEEMLALLEREDLVSNIGS